MLNPNGPAIEYAALTKLVDLAANISQQKKRSKMADSLARAAKIRYFLKALDDKVYLTDDQVNQIYQCLISTAQLYEIPSALSIVERPAPAIITGIQGPQGIQGIPGLDGFGTDFSRVNVTTNTVADEFPITDAYAARWHYLIRSIAGQREGEVRATWTQDGLNITYYESSSVDIIGSTDPVSFQVTVFGSNIRLMAIVPSGIWDISGTRYYTPGNGAGTGPVNAVLPDGKVFIGNVSNVATAQTLSGDITITNTGVASIGSGVIVNADINASAGILSSKLAALTPSRVAVLDGSGFLAAGTPTTTEVNYLSGVTSNIQTQLDSKIGSVTGAISPVVSVNLTPSRIVVSDPSGKIAVGGASSTEAGYLIGVTSAIQTQLNNKLTISSGPQLLIKTIQIGDWNMDTDATKSVAHGLSDFRKVRAVSGMVRNDADTVYTPFIWVNNTASDSLTINSVTTTDILMLRGASGNFDSALYSATSYNRGWLTITYEV